MKDYLRLLYLSRRNWHYLAGGIIAMVFSAFFEGTQITAIIPLADRVFSDKPIVLPTGIPPFLTQWAAYFNQLDRMTLFYGIIFITPVFFIAKNGVAYLRGLFMNTLAQRTVTDVRGDIFRQYQNLSMDFYSQKRQGELMSRITHDAGFVGHAISYGITDVVYQTLLAVVFAVLAVTISLKMVLAIIVIFPLSAAIIYFIGRTIKKQSIQSQESMADLNSVIAEANQGVPIVRAFSREDHEIARFEKSNWRYYRATIKGIRRNLVLSPVTEILGMTAVIFIFWMGGRRVIEGTMSFGVLVLFITAVVSIQRPIKKLAEVYGIIQQALAANRRLYDILDWKPTIVEAPAAVECRRPARVICFDRVVFKYNKDEARQIIDGFSHDFEIGKTTALVGPTGCGKTTVMNMVLRFYDPDTGSVYFDDQDIRGVSIKSLRSHIGLVTQDMFLFNDTIRGNLLYGNLQATEEQISDAMGRALAREFIDKMPQGLDTVVGDRGFKLSGGQKQRLCIARAILKNPRILLLDEATSALDAESEYLVQQALENLMQNRTVIVIAHRLSTIRHADCILVMDNGRIVQKGKHDDLLTQSPLYAKLASYHFNQ